jgi:hypothetical protein
MTRIEYVTKGGHFTGVTCDPASAQSHTNAIIAGGSTITRVTTVTILGSNTPRDTDNLGPTGWWTL